MDFATFVNAFWKKLQWSGKPWDPPIIVTVTGMPAGQVNAWWEWCQAHETLTDAQLIALWETEGLVTIHTPFGDLYQPKVGGDPNRHVGDLTVAELDAMLFKHCGK